MRMAPVTRRLFEPVDIASLVCFRILFGAIMVWEVGRYFHYEWIERYYFAPKFHFSYYGFARVHPWPGAWMYVHFAALGVLGACITLGLFYRVSAVLFFLGFTYVFLLDQAQYLNHFYLVSLISFLLIFVPAHRAVSLDARLFPARRSDTAPAWALWILRFQLGLVYFYAGIAKINHDWLRGEPMRAWLARRTDYTLGPIPIGHWFTEEWVVYFFAYGGLLLDMFIAPLLVWRRTRVPAFVAGLTFHLLNAWLFQIGIFPWFAMAGLLLFFDPAGPRQMARRLLGRGPAPPAETGPVDAAVHPWRRRLVVGLLGGYVAPQVLVPLRHFLYPGEVSWTEEGHRFSWHMKLRDKSARATFTALDPATGEEWTIDMRRYLTSRQRRKMAARPDMILQFCHLIADQLRQSGRPGVQVRAEVMASLNGRPRQPLIDPAVDLAAEPRTLGHATWILPLKGEAPTRHEVDAEGESEPDE